MEFVSETKTIEPPPRVHLKGLFGCPETNLLHAFGLSLFACFLGWRDKEGKKPSCHKNMLVLTALEAQRGWKLCAVTWQWLQVLTRGLKEAIFLLCCARELESTLLSLCTWSEGHAADFQNVQWNSFTKWLIWPFLFFYRVYIYYRI